MNSQKSHILYIDDEKQNLSGFKYVFKKHYQVHIALSAEEGWEILNTHPIKVIISDQRMPKVTGTQFLEKAAEKFPMVYRIILTAYTDVQEIIAAINQGKIFQYIRKPWDKDEVKVIIDNAIQLFDLKAQNNELLESLKQNNAQLEEVNQSLEQKVAERTRELEKHKENLEETIKKRTIELEKAKVKAEESDRLKSAFLANVSHEIRTPMNAIIGFSEILTNMEVPEEDRAELRQQIVLNSESLLRLIDDIIDISKIEANQISIAFDNHNLNTILKELHVIFEGQKHSLEKGHINLVLDIPEDTYPIINTDKIRLHQVLSNLINNALKFTDSGTIRFGYRMLKEDDKCGCVQFFVEDSGIGIPENAHHLIFERFRKAKTSEDKIYRGTGLGLFISKHLIEKLNGTIWVESEPDSGSKFLINLPCCVGLAADDTISTKEPIREKTSYNFSNKLILVAEDEDSSFSFIEKAVQETNAKIIRANNGQESLEILKEQPVDIILMDIQMPVMNGYEAIEKIKQMYSSIPIVAQTAYALTNQKREVLNTGCNDILSKPFHKEDLLRTIDKYINLSLELK